MNTWYSEIVAGVFEGDNDVLFNGPLNDDFAYFTHWKNLWDLDEETTVELGGSFAYGRNETGGPNSDSRVAGGNLTVKWIPTDRARYRQVEFQTEYLYSSKETGVANSGLPRPNEDKDGLYAYLKYQFLQNWWIQGRYGIFGLSEPGMSQEKHRWSGLLAYVPTEFSAVRLQYNYQDDRVRDEHQVLLQLNFTMGSHPAHLY